MKNRKNRENRSNRFKSILPGGVGVKVISTKSRPDGDINAALRSFKKELKDSGKLEELMERRYYIPDSAKHREKMKRARFHQWVSDIISD
tara:strand:+ start:1440 stop:1709 length:270 start_codon:yes stop_codon:yes gene_type:complete